MTCRPERMTGRFLACVTTLALAACSSSGDSSKSGKGGSNGGGSNGSDGNIGLGSDTGGGNGSTADGGGAGSTVDDLRNAACAQETAATEPLPAVLMLVVDVSGSMSQSAPGSRQSKWQVTRDALAGALDELSDGTGVGVLYYPNRDTTASRPTGTESDPPRDPSACLDTGGVIPPAALGPSGSQHRTRLLNSLQNVNGPQGGTPTHDAYRTALPALQSTTLPGDRYMLLITDGQPTFLSGCRGTGNIRDAVDPRPIITEAEQAKMQGISTFVIGSPGSEEVGVPVFSDARTWLSQTASVGGTAQPGCSDDGPNFCHFDMTQEPDFSQALREALGQVVGQVLSCTYKLPSPPSGSELAPNEVNLILTPDGGDPEIITQSTTSDCAEGWVYSDDGNNIVLCDSTCDRVKSAENPRLELLFGCQTEFGPIR